MVTLATRPTSALDRADKFVLNGTTPFGCDDPEVYLNEAHAVLACLNVINGEKGGPSEALMRQAYEATQTLLAIGLLALENERRADALRYAGE